MHVVVPPVLVDDRICRIVAAIESLLEVEEWVGAWWAPSSVPLTQVNVAPAAPLELLHAHGVPESDCVAGAERPRQFDLEASMRAADPARPEGMRFDEERVERATPARARTYPGNARFRRDTPRQTAALESAEPAGTSPSRTTESARRRRTRDNGGARDASA